ncbi:TetR/AcrR family transcriptional regulator [Konateibacter massiliensis]|uniref:TetR/AcrR family transcriptional regulator n=1 Tax=Konateibacter massiliensis TaxID=2002841 RepID=UPI000C14F068|nr:TetR family transcriptional regulator [Konateibacter massiliensis]
MDNIDLRVLKTLENIDSSLLGLLTRMPFHKITVDMICKEARINRSTFYKYYFDKYDLLDKYLEKVLKELQVNIRPNFIEASPEQLMDKRYSDEFMQILDFFWARRYPYQVLWHAVIDRHIYNEMIEIIQQQLMAKLDKDTLKNPQKNSFAMLYSFLFANNLMSTVHWWYQYNKEMSKEDVRRLMDDNMRMGLFKSFKQKID